MPRGLTHQRPEFPPYGGADARQPETRRIRLSWAGPMFAAAALLTLVTVAAEGPAPSRVDAVRVHGELHEEVWQNETPTDAFVERDPTDGGEPSERTEFRVAYNDTT